MKILAIGAHPDDIEIFMFGLLSIFNERGDKVFLSVATDGSLGAEKKNRSNLNLIRKQETIKGLKDLGVPNFLNITDGSLGNSYKHINTIKSHVDNIKPDLIITHSPLDYHSDHINLSKILKNIASHYIPILYCDTMMGINFMPNYYVDITKFFKKKQKSILCHKSQNPERFSKLSELMNRYRSAQCNAPNNNYAEAYYFQPSFPYSDIRDLLPKSPKIKSFTISKLNGFL